MIVRKGHLLGTRRAWMISCIGFLIALVAVNLPWRVCALPQKGEADATVSTAFGFHPARIRGSKPFAYATDIGVTWERKPKVFFWAIIQRDPDKPSRHECSCSCRYDSAPCRIDPASPRPR